MNRSRPVNLNLFTIRFPLTAIVSILHRISGVFLFLFVPFAIWLLNFSLTPEGYDILHDWQEGTVTKIIIWLLLIPFIYHLVAGIRHLISDLQIGVTKSGGKRSSQLVFIITFLLVVLAGIWLW